MAFKQPKVPEYRGTEKIEAYIHKLTLFLRDFCQEAWNESRLAGKMLGKVQGDIAGIDYPVGSVNGKTGDVVLGAGDVGAVESVNGKSGKVQLVAADVGALSSDPREAQSGESETGSALPINADQLGGRPAGEYALKTDAAQDSERLGGYAPEKYIRHEELSAMVRTITLASVGSVSGGGNVQKDYTLDIPEGYDAHVLAVHISNTTNNAYGKVNITFSYEQPVIHLSVFNSGSSGVSPAPICTYMLVKKVD